MDQARGLALRLHALHAADRAWLLERVDEEPRRRLQALLAEIAEIGLLPDAELLAFAAANDMPDMPLPKREADAAIRIDGAEVETVRTVLDLEPRSVRRCLYDLGAWSWRKTLVAGLPGQRNEPIMASMDAVPPIRLTPRARAAVLQAFAIAIVHCQEHSGLPSAPEKGRKAVGTGTFVALRSRLRRQG